MTTETDWKQGIGPVLGRVPSGVFIVTAKSPDGRQETAMLASWVQQVSFEPAMVTVAVNRKRYLNDWLESGRPIACSIVGDSQTKLLSHFGKGFEPGQEAFTALTTARSPQGLTVLPDSIGWLEGNIVGKMEAGDHILYAVELKAGAPGERLATERPFVHLRKNGFGY